MIFFVNGASNDISVNNFKNTNIALPVAGSDAANKEYVDRFFETGVEQTLQMNSFRISGLGAPINSRDAITGNKNYADELFNYLRRHLIQIDVLNEEEIVSTPDVFRLIRKESETTDDSRAGVEGSETQPQISTNR